jgi:hypothetical protein
VSLRQVWPVLILSTLLAAGCRTAPVSPGGEVSRLSEPVLNEALNATVVSPEGWTRQEVSRAFNHVHENWVSPTGKTSYGIIHFMMPIPVGTENAFRYGFLAQMKRDEGEATVLEQAWDESIEGLRFVAEGGRYRIRTFFVVRGLRGWAVYAGTLKNEAVIETELELAERAREATVLAPER